MNIIGSYKIFSAIINTLAFSETSALDDESIFATVSTVTFTSGIVYAIQIVLHALIL